jgi:DNA-binding winged helix-turn-helix (wHTH) protein/tetratricopeptide (TPR) repeat protein
MAQTAQPIYEFDDFRLDAGRRLLSRAGETVPLTSKCFETLLALLEGGGETVEKDALLSRVWPDTVVEEKNLTINISTLRKALGESPQEHRYIVTVPGRGYRFVAEVRAVAEGETELVVQQSKVRVVVEEEEDGETERRRDGEIKTLPAAPSPHHPVALVAVAALLVALISGATYWWRTRESAIRNPPSAIKTLAVLPFKSLNPQSGEDYLGIGLTDVTITRLSNLNQLVVRPTRAVLPYATQDPLAAGQALKVDSVLDGSIQQVGQRVRVTLRLLRVEDSKALWTYQCDELCTDVFALQDTISQKVTEALAVKLTGGERERLLKRHTDNLEAYRAYLKGRYFWNKRTEEGLNKGIECFKQAIASDPNYALAYVGLADCYSILTNQTSAGLPPREAMPQAREAALRALELDNALAEAHASLGYVKHTYDWDYAAGEREYHRALELNPNYATAHNWYAFLLASQGRLDEAIRQNQRALELDPLSLVINSTAGRMLYFAGQYEQAVERFRKTVELDPGFARGHLEFALVYEQQGKYQEAIAELRQAVALSANNPSTLAHLGGAYARAGERGEALKILAELQRLAPQHYVSAFNQAIIYTSLGERERAFEWLEKAYEERANPLTTLKVEHIFDSLRADPRFADLLRRAGLQP